MQLKSKLIYKSFVANFTEISVTFFLMFHVLFRMGFMYQFMMPLKVELSFEVFLTKLTKC